MAVFLPKGTRDLLPAQMHNRLRVLATLRDVFSRFGFEPLETPAFERIETLTGKYGDEGDKLIYKILERGEGGKQGKADLALRYDLTVPFARVLAMHPELRLPFKRWQMQPVWRADRPQKGRYREFWQCDVDIAGATSPVADAECVAVVAASLDALGFQQYTIRVNDRRILADLAARAGATDAREETSVLVALDKLDKIGRDGVTNELGHRGFTGEAVEAMWAALEPQETNEATLAHLDALLGERGKAGVATLREVLPAALALGVSPDRLRIDPTLARGLDYYTGPVFEATVDEPKVGSIAGGGRYDGLIGMFSGRVVPAVGVALGLERIIDVMEELGMLPATSTAVEVLVTVFDAATLDASLRAASALRDEGVRAEVFLGEGKLKQQLKYADAKGVPWVLVLGPDEVAQGVCTLRDLSNGSQEQLPISEVPSRLRLARPLL